MSKGRGPVARALDDPEVLSTVYAYRVDHSTTSPEPTTDGEFAAAHVTGPSALGFQIREITGSTDKYRMALYAVASSGFEKDDRVWYRSGLADGPNAWRLVEPEPLPVGNETMIKWAMKDDSRGNIGAPAPAAGEWPDGSPGAGDSNPPGNGSGDTSAPTAPSGLGTGTVTTASVDLLWSASTDDTGVDHYNVLKNGSEVKSVTGTTATVSGLSGGTAYDFSVTAEDTAGNVSPPSSTVSVTTDSANTAPTGVIEDFETGDLSGYSGTKSALAVKQDPRADGTYGLVATGSGSEIWRDTPTGSGPRTARGNYYTYEAEAVSWYQGDQQVLSLAIGADPVNGPVLGDGSAYLISISADNPIAVRHLPSDAPFEADITGSTTGRVPADTQITVEVKWDDGSLGGSAGDIAVTVYDDTGAEAASATASDTSISSGTFGWVVEANSDADSFADTLRTGPFAP